LLPERKRAKAKAKLVSRALTKSFRHKHVRYGLIRPSFIPFPFGAFNPFCTGGSAFFFSVLSFSGINQFFKHEHNKITHENFIEDSKEPRINRSQSLLKAWEISKSLI